MLARAKFWRAIAAGLAASVLALAQPALAQIPAFLPDKESVAVGEASEIDGDWRVSTIGKIIRIEGARAYALEGWTHAFVLAVKPGMVTIRNIQKTGENEYVGDDLPMMGKVTLRVVSPDRIEASVPGLFGATRYALIRVAGAAPGAPPGAASRAPVIASAGDPASSPEAPSSGAYRQSPVKYASLAEAFGAPHPVSETFRGCPIPADATREGAASDPPATPRERIGSREFAPPARQEVRANSDEACWRRIDGVWAENRGPTFDVARNDGREWDAQGTALAGLLHGNYTTPATLFIVAGDQPEEELWAMSGTDALKFTRFRSDDGISIEELIRNPGATKRYRAAQGAPSARDLTVDYTAGGTLRIRMAGKQFGRPSAGKTSDISMDDVFVIQYQTDNFAANLKGYNVLSQDPFLLMSNNLGEVFARRGRDEYRIEEKYAVPFGFTLKNELLQGNVYRRTLNASESELQSTAAKSFGANAKVSVSGAVNSVLAFIPGAGSVADTGYGAGFKSSNETMRSLRQHKMVGQLVGYSRAKSYAIVLEHANAKLSSSFLTAVADAQRSGDYAALIERFGTHYPYAVTYGAAAKMTQDISEEGFSSALSESKGVRVEAEAQLVGSSVGGFVESMRGGLRGTSGRIGNEGGRFVAVGGNGSWDSGGYARGDRVAPILLDLRPLDELLNPINFPDSPEIYTSVRTALAKAINIYLAANSKQPSHDRLISRVAFVAPPPKEEEITEPAGEKEQEWHIYIKSVDCIKAAFDGKYGVEGNATLQVISGGTESAQDRRLEASCKKKSTTRTAYKYNARSKQEGLLILRGTPSELRNRTIRVAYAWDYVPGWKKTTTRLDIFLRDYLSLAAGKYREIRKKVTKKRNPDLSLQIRVRRVR